MEIILGSQSPRRAEILRFFSVPFKQIPSSFDEETVAFKGDPVAYVKTLAQKKAESLAISHPEAVILTADTVVFCNEKIYNKPKDETEAASFLQELSGRQHSVFTATALIEKGRTYVLCEETKIRFRTLTRLQIDQYLQHVNFLDKAGSYAIQQSGGLIVESIEGCYYNVMGLPLGSLQNHLMRVGIDLWTRLKIL